MANNIQCKNYHLKYSISDYNQICRTYTEPNLYNIVYLQNFYMHKVSILNVKAFTERCKYLENWKNGTIDNINRLKKLCDAAVTNPPIITNGIAPATQKIEELIKLLDEYKKNLEKVNTHIMLERAKTIRNQEIEETIRALESYIKMEEKERENNLADSKLTITDYVTGNV